MPNQRIRLSLMQANPIAGDLTSNSNEVIRAIRDESGTDLIVFPELFLSGYPLGDLIRRESFLDDAEAAIRGLRDAVIEANGPSVLIGAPLRSSGRPRNVAILICPDGDVRTVRMRGMPDAADDGDQDVTETFKIGEFRIGVQLGDDLRNGSVSRVLADDCADVLITLAARPYRRGSDKERRDIAAARVRVTGLPFIFLNQVGGQDEQVFDGGSFTMNTNGGAMFACRFGPDVMRVNLVRKESGGVRIEGVEERSIASSRAGGDDDRAGVASDYEACVLGLRDYVTKTGAPRVLVGVSGGLDSALVLAMAADALGPDRVIGVMMPSEHTGEESLNLADDLMRSLGVRGLTVPLSGAYGAMDEAVTPKAEALASALGVPVETGITRQNYQARLRGVILMGLSNAIGGLVLSTGNKSEIAVGYCTLYGDMAGGFNPLKSVYKSDAFLMARWRNGCEPAPMGLLGPEAPIPERIIDRPPTAELAAGQTDEDSLGAYDVLDAVLRAIIEDRKSSDEAALLIRRRFGEEGVMSLCGGMGASDYALRVARMVRSAEHKRAQAAPGVSLGTSDFGSGWRYPIAGRYDV